MFFSLKWEGVYWIFVSLKIYLRQWTTPVEADQVGKCKENFLPVVDEGEVYEIMSKTRVFYRIDDIT